MKHLRLLRILLAALFFLSALACLILGTQVSSVALAAGRMQIILSTISVTLGATLVWLLITFLFGRVYCATVCPIGTLSDLFLRCRNLIPGLRRKPFRYRQKSRATIHLMWIYFLCIIIGPTAISYLLEPWYIMQNIVSIFHVSTLEATWISIGVNALVGVVAGVISLILIAATSIWRGREFCSRFCPLGTAMGLISDYSIYHIEIDPDRCSYCGVCENVCRCQCINGLSRYVDNSRCVRCFDCVAKCPDDAIRFQPNRNRPATPLMRRAKE